MRRFAGWFVGNLPHLVATRAPLAAWRCYFHTAMRRPGLERYRHTKAHFLQDAVRTGQFSTDWFSGNIPYWLAAFEHYQMVGRPVRALEIGSWEGLSSRFLLDTLPMAHLTCVDTWEGADEHQGLPLQVVEERFDRNLARHASRLTKCKGTSLAFFAAQPAEPTFDLIYVDGSHHSDDVIVDAIKGFERLKPSGLMIFDDYMWRFYPRRNDDPAAAIHAMLQLKAGCYELFMVYAQVILRKKDIEAVRPKGPIPGKPGLPL